MKYVVKLCCPAYYDILIQDCQVEKKNKAE